MCGNWQQHLNKKNVNLGSIPRGSNFTPDLCAVCVRFDFDKECVKLSWLVRSVTKMVTGCANKKLCQLNQLNKNGFDKFCPH